MKSNNVILKKIWALVFPFLKRAKNINKSYEPEISFSEIYKSNKWSSNESVSGPGSELFYSKNLIKELQKIIKKYEINSIIDAPCGDCNWIKEVSFPANLKYLGVDIVEELICINQSKKFVFTNRINFICEDITSYEFEKYDLWISRDVLIHLSNENCIKLLNNFLFSQSSFFMANDYPFVYSNIDIKNGNFRFINLHKEPFNLPKPIYQFDDYIFPSTPRTIKIWSREQIYNSVIK